MNWRVSARRNEPWVTVRHPDQSGDLVFLLDTFSDLGPDAAPHAAAGFSADGGWLGLAATRREGPVGLLPGSLGFALGWPATRRSGRETMFQGTVIRSGEATRRGALLDLGDEAARER